ncbi:MAG TPA: sugar phosphate isomerase/epimerase [Vicinamibacterales bacterium]|nr:sugar phosphate isomerase/epimerase [Vicinamibacterales bacterium]
MSYSRREFGKLALAGLPAAAVLGRAESLFGAFAQTKPNSLINGVQIGAITYSFRQMPDQSAEATLKYILESGISAVEIMGGPVESFAGAPRREGRGGGAGRAGGGGGGRGPAGRGREGAAEIPPGAKTGSWNGVTCVIPEEGARGGGGGGGRGRGNAANMTPEEQAAQAAEQAVQQEQAKKLKEWRTTVSMEPFKKLRKMYNDAGVSIYAWKALNANMSDEEFEYIFNVAEALGATHTTLELPAGENAAAQLKRIGDFAMKKKIYAAYHTHAQGSMTAFDQAFAISKGNMANVDLGHWTAGGNKGGSQMDFLNKYHARTSSFHLKDRTTPEHCELNLPWGTGETPIKDILQLVRKNKWKIPASVEFEYAIPEGSDAVQEVRKCVEYCKTALNAPMTTASR